MRTCLIAFRQELEKLAIAQAVPMYVVPIRRIDKKKPLEETTYEKGRSYVLGGVRGGMTGAGAAGIVGALRGGTPSKALMRTLTAAGGLVGVADKIHQRKQQAQFPKSAMVVKKPPVNPLQPLAMTPGRALRSAMTTARTGNPVRVTMPKAPTRGAIGV